MRSLASVRGGYRERYTYMISAKRLTEIAAIPDAAIDTSDIPEAGDHWFAKATLKRRYTLTVESLRFAGLLTDWACAYGIDVEHDVASAAMRHGRKGTTIKPRLPVVLSFASTEDRAKLLRIARERIAALRSARPTGGKRGARAPIPTPEDVDRIVAALEASYRGLS